MRVGAQAALALAARGCPAVLGFRARCRTRFVRCAHCVQTPAASQLSKRAGTRAALKPAFLGGAIRPHPHPARRPAGNSVCVRGSAYHCGCQARGRFAAGATVRSRAAQQRGGSPARQRRTDEGPIYGRGPFRAASRSGPQSPRAASSAGHPERSAGQAGGAPAANRPRACAQSDASHFTNPNSRPALAKAATAVSRCCRSCTALSCTRMRAWPLGTTGKKKPTT
jgi:hypothetical protein